MHHMRMSRPRGIVGLHLKCTSTPSCETTFKDIFDQGQSRRLTAFPRAAA
jgi:hypothetical protein